MPTTPVFHAPLTPPRSSITMTELRVAVLRAAEDGLPLTALPAWLNAYDSARTPGFGDRPIDLLRMVMGTQRADLLATVLDVPAFCPTETRTDRRTAEESPIKAARLEAWHGHDLFNGGLDVAAAMPGEPGMVWTEARVEVALQADALKYEATSRSPDPSGFRPQAPGSNFTRLEAHDPLRQVPATVQHVFDVQQQRQARALGGSGFPEDYRHTGGTNLLGLAVMMGWDEGLSVLLEHGVNPYAHVDKHQAYASPLLLAGLYGETACAIALIQHSSFKPQARYGHTETEARRLRYEPDDRGMPWHDRSEFGGFDLTFLLENPVMAQDPTVRAALLPRLTKGVVKRLTSSEGLSVTARHTLERWVLEQAAQDVSNGLSSSVERSRARPRL